MSLETVIENMQADPKITEQQIGSVVQEYNKEEKKKKKPKDEWKLAPNEIGQNIWTHNYEVQKLSLIHI